MRLDDYLRRVGVTPPIDPTADALRRLHRAHRERVLFENLSIQTGGGVSVGLDDVERKIVDQGRGGYCFEHNTLFAGALRAIGFAPVVLLGRVRRGPPDTWRRTHMVLRVPVGDGVWLADVGFGAAGLLEPMSLRDGATSHATGFEYTLRREEYVWVLSMRGIDSALDLYEFSDDPQSAGDVEVANHYTATHPDSIFRRTLTIQRTGRDEGAILRNYTLTRLRAGRIVDEPVAPADLRDVAREQFGVEIPPGPLLFESYTTAAENAPA